MGKTSLERSHSKLSNFKLTLLCLLAIISFNLIFVGIALYNFNSLLSLIVSITGGAIAFLMFILITAFTR